MACKELGKLHGLKDLRVIWPNEARDFTTWLAREENLEMLGEAIGIDMAFEEIESNVGDFNVDIFAKEQFTGKNIVIENQLGDTDHDHLGKLLTYAAGKDAAYVIWIAKKGREEHKFAIEWLNNHTDSEVNFFLLEIELWRIDESLPAPKFNVVARPNGWAKKVRESTRALSEIQERQLKFWEQFREFATTREEKLPGNLSFRKPQPYNLDVTMGVPRAIISLTNSVTKGTVSAAIYINDDKSLYRKFLELEPEIKARLGQPVKWNEGAKAARFFITMNFNIMDDESSWDKCFAWLYEQIMKLNAIYKLGASEQADAQ